MNGSPRALWYGAQGVWGARSRTEGDRLDCMSLAGFGNILPVAGPSGAGSAPMIRNDNQPAPDPILGHGLGEVQELSLREFSERPARENRRGEPAPGCAHSGCPGSEPVDLGLVDLGLVDFGPIDFEPIDLRPDQLGPVSLGLDSGKGCKQQPRARFRALGCQK
jgi:hypothetical protein